jgi:scyllo-inositol 2-dehydrogenase (NADP+)
MMKAGLIGRGMAGTVFHAPLIRAVANMELVSTSGSADAGKLLSESTLDLVVIATPNASYLEFAATALENGTS